MTPVGQRERSTQDRVIRLFRDVLKYDYLGNWEERMDNSNIEEQYLRTFLKKQGYTENLITRALFELGKTAGDQSKSLYDVNKAVYSYLRYGIKVKPEAGENSETVWLIDWKNPQKNHFAIAEEVTAAGQHEKRPDIVLYVNGIAMGVLELKRYTVSVAEGIRQNLDNQRPEFIREFFATIQLIMAGNDTEGLRYAIIETPEKYNLTWKEAGDIEIPLDRHLACLCAKERFLKLIHDFIVFDAGTKKICRHNQYFGVKAAQAHVKRREGGIIWHTQGSGKSLTMVWLAQLKQKWGTMQKILSSQSRLEKIVADIMLDMATKDRLVSGRGNALLVSDSIYNACKYYELFTARGLDRCAIVTSYRPSVQDIKGETAGEGDTELLKQYGIYQNMLSRYFSMPPDEAVRRVEEFEKEAKRKFINEPGQMKLLIVVDKLLTGFDAPPATYLYIDKHMQDHGLFQAICRVNRLDGDDKEYGYVIDCMDLFKSLEGAVKDYTSGAFDGYDKEDVAGLLSDRLGKARERLEEAREAVKALCEPVEPPKDTMAYIRYFCASDTSDMDALKETEPKRLALYKLTVSLVRAYADLANEMVEAGYTPSEIATIQQEVAHFENVRTEVKLASGDYIDLKMYEPAMRHLIDTYIQAEESQVLSSFDDMSLIQLIVERGEAAIESLPKGIRQDKNAAAETIENNLRKVIIDEHPINPKYYEKMSLLLDALIQERKNQALEYQEYLKNIVKLTKQVQNPAGGADYPVSMDSAAKRALYDNLDQDKYRATLVDDAVCGVKKDGWRGHRVKEKEVKYAIKGVLNDDALTEQILELVKNQSEISLSTSSHTFCNAAMMIVSAS